MRALRLLVLALVLVPLTAGAAEVRIQAYDVPSGGRPHDVAVSANGVVWYTAQRSGHLGRLDPKTGKVDLIPLGSGAAPHGVIVGPDGAPWVTEGGQNAIARVDPETHAVRLWRLPQSRGYVNLNTATFDNKGRIWFTGQNGAYGVLDPKSDEMKVWDAPRGRGPYGIATAPDGTVYYASLAGSHIVRIDVETGAATVIEPPTRNQGARRVWADSKGHVWVSEWNSGKVSRHDPKTGEWRQWDLPGDRPQPYAVYVDHDDKVWLSDFGANAMVRFDPETMKFETFKSDKRGANVRQILGRPGEIWAPESGNDRLIVYRTR